MSKLWSLIGHTAYIREEYRLPVSDHTTQKLSCWTYADMKRECARSMEFFTKSGFSDECVNLAYECVCLKRYFAKDQRSVAAMTENVMANTIRVIEAFRSGSEQAVSRRKYEEQISAYRSAETHRLTLSPEEQTELDRDIQAALKMIQRLEYAKQNDDDEDGIEIHFDKHFTVDYKSVIKSPPPADSDKRMREKLSDKAYEMLTEYERESEIVDKSEAKRS